jgi:hypothetical protein
MPARSGLSPSSTSSAPCPLDPLDSSLYALKRRSKQDRLEASLFLALDDVDFFLSHRHIYTIGRVPSWSKLKAQMVELDGLLRGTSEQIERAMRVRDRSSVRYRGKENVSVLLFGTSERPRRRDAGRIRFADLSSILLSTPAYLSQKLSALLTLPQLSHKTYTRSLSKEDARSLLLLLQYEQVKSRASWRNVVSALVRRLRQIPRALVAEQELIMFIYFPYRSKEERQSSPSHTSLIR